MIGPSKLLILIPTLTYKETMTGTPGSLVRGDMGTSSQIVLILSGAGSSSRNFGSRDAKTLALALNPDGDIMG